MTRPQKENPKEHWQDVKARRDERGIVQLTLLLQRGDVDLLDFLTEKLGVNKGEALRTSLRVYSAILAQMKKT